METEKEKLKILENKEEINDVHSLSKILEHSNKITEIKKLEVSGEGEVDLVDKLRLESFKNFSTNMKEALSHISNMFKGTQAPWAIHGSTALVLEAETAKKPVDIDIAFADVDYDNVFARFKGLENAGVLRNLEPKALVDETGMKNGCTRISAEIRVGKGTEEEPYEWVEVEAFSQNIDPDKKPNGFSNIGFEKMTVMKYEGENDLELNFASREENFRFYLQIAAIELQKYHLDNALKEGGMKNKFPQRLNNILAIIKRREREEIIKSGARKLEDDFNFENVTPKNIAEIVKEFSRHNMDLRESSMSHAKTVEDKLDPILVLVEKLEQFKESKEDGDGVHEGYIGQRSREGVLDELTQENVIDMKDLASKYINLQKLKKEFNDWASKCENGCEDFLRDKILEEKKEILNKTEETIKIILETKNKYEGYMGQINYKDNRDFIPFIAIRETLDSYIGPSLKVAEGLKSEIETMEIPDKKPESLSSES